MKILCTSDLHGNLEHLSDFVTPEIEVIALAGDIAVLSGRGKWHIYDQKKWIEKRFFKFVSNYPQIKFIFTPGNHDFFPIAANRYPDLNFNLIWPNNCKMLVDEKYEYNGKIFYGTPWVPPISNSWAFESETDIQKSKFSKIPYNVDLLITHSPPHIGSDKLIDRSLQFGVSESFGSNVLADAIIEKQPKVCICGHIHSGDHQCHTFFNSKIYNVSRLDENYEIAYDPIIIDI